MNGKYALIVANTEYIDTGLARLTTPSKDAEDFSRVLEAKEFGNFNDVSVLLNEPEYIIREAIEGFFNQKKPDDLLLLYFSGHGVRDEFGSLYLAVKNTIRTRLRSTGIKSDYIRDVMDQSRSRRQILILDCCNSGAFSQGTKAATGVSIGTAPAFKGGYGRIILTASDSTQYAWEGEKIIGETDNSVFTHYLVQGLKGEADLNSDGRITVDELYDFTYENVKLATPNQTPSKFSSRQQGEIVLRDNLKDKDIKLIPLPEDLNAAIKSSLPYIREGAVRQLEAIINGKNLGLVRSAREALEYIAQNDDSRTVSRMATQILESILQHSILGEGKDQEVEEDPKSPNTAGLLRLSDHEQSIDPNNMRYGTTEIMTEEEHAGSKQIQQEGKVGVKAISNTYNELIYTQLPKLGGLVYIVIGWSIGWAFGWGLSIAQLASSNDGIGYFGLWGATGGLFGGVGITFAFRDKKSFPYRKQIRWIPLWWAIGHACVGLLGGYMLSSGSSLFFFLWFPLGTIVSITISSLGTLVALLGFDYLLSIFGRVIWIIFGWITSMVCGGALGIFIVGLMLSFLDLMEVSVNTNSDSVSIIIFAVMGAVGGAISGLVGGMITLVNIRIVGKQVLKLPD